MLKSSGLYGTKLIVWKELVIAVANKKVGVVVREVVGLEFREGAFPDERGCLVLGYVGGGLKQNRRLGSVEWVVSGGGVVVDGGLNCHGLSGESCCSAVQIGGSSSREPRRRHPRGCGEENKEATKKLGFWKKAWEREGVEMLE